MENQSLRRSGVHSTGINGRLKFVEVLSTGAWSLQNPQG